MPLPCAVRRCPMTDPAAATKAALRSLARRWQAVQAEIDLDAQLTPLVTTAAPELVALPGVGVDTAGQLLVTAGDYAGRLRSERFSRACAVCAGPGVLRPHRPAPAAPRRRPRRQQRLVAHRPGPHALPPAHQGLRRQTHRRGPNQERDPALPQALHRPPGLPCLLSGRPASVGGHRR
jgi:transposase